MRLGLGVLLGFGIFLFLLLSFGNFFVMFALEVLLFGLGLWYRFEEAFESGLLGCLDILLQFLRSTSYTVFIEPFLVD